MEKFDVIFLSEETFARSEPEGAVSKLWVQTPEGTGLFKEACQNPYYQEVRNDWPEKIVSELSIRLSIPAARYELAQFESSEGGISGSISFELSDYGGKREPLEKFLEESIENYNYGSDYHVSSVMNFLEKQNVQLPTDYSLPKGIRDASDILVGALMLDALTSNIDRHSRNFDLITISDEGIRYLSPVFDNGRSLGSFLNDEVKENRSVSDYSMSAYSSITVEGYQKNGLEVFQEAAKFRPQAAKIWQQTLSKIAPQQINELFDRIPDGIITPTSKKFAIDLLNHNQKQLLDLEIKLSPSETQQMRVEKIAPILIDYLRLNEKKQVESDKSIVEFDSKNKTITYQNKIDKDEYLSAQYIDKRWIDKGSNISQSKESYFTDDAAAKIERLKAKKLEATYPKSSNKESQKRRSL